MTFVAEVIDKQFYSGLGLATHFSIYEIQFTRHQREAQARDQRSATDRAQGRGNVSASTSNTRAPITTQDDVGPRARPRKNTKSNFLRLYFFPFPPFPLFVR